MKIDIAIVGGGIVGLWSAYYILKKHPQLTVVVFEAESYLGEHTTGRNSEVLHSGLYYPTNSLRHIHCLAGNRLWREYIKTKRMPFLDCGKVIVATKGQDESLDTLRRKCVENGTLGVRSLRTDEIKSLGEVLHINNGFFIGSSGVLDVSEAIKAIEHDIEAMGGMIIKNNKVSIKQFGNEHFVLNINGDSITASKLINTAGLYAVNLRESLGLTGYENYYVKGSYLILKKKIDIDKLIYPIPPSHGLGLGVHLTLDTSGGQKFGPNAEAVKNVNYSLNESLISEMSPAIHSIFKNISDENLQLGYSGVRPKVKKNNVLETDFIFNTEKVHGIKGYYEFLGIESPGLTASPSLAKMLSEKI